ncbi:hypothetical protein QBC44DRAFT_336124 [Cladorrhinum sp. PSN332]|nr:hypothetical protein QBC44DRAFT_336124 [Cladorrhinum sp. PSN332]
MGLVDYCSSSESDDQDLPPSKKPRPSGTRSPHPPKSAPSRGSVSGLDPGTSSPSPDGSLPPPNKKPRLSNPELDSSGSLPPLPPQFYDLYASTVRTTTIDAPSLHQGRTRQIPHAPGRWPSFLYIEWIPPPAVYDLLSSLLTALSSSIIPLTSFLTNDLHVRQPLHISLSRTLSFTTYQKDNFLKQIQTTVSKSNIKPFTLSATAVEWHRTPESDRSFLVLRVNSSDSNSELTTLLKRFNSVCKEYSQPELYSRSTSSDPDPDPDTASSAFHVSIAWSFSQPTDEIMQATENVFSGEKVKSKIEKEISIEVESVKARIGNVVTNIELSSSGKKKGNLFGMGL